MYGDVAFTIWAGATEPDINVLAPTTVFPDTAVSRASKLNFTIENNGTADLLLLGAPSITFIGADASFFSVRSGPSSPVLAGTSTSFEVAYKPRSKGIHVVTMRITSNDPDTPDYDIVLTGTGKPRPDDNDDLGDKVNSSVGCSLQTGANGSSAFYLALLIAAVALKLRRRVTFTN